MEKTCKTVSSNVAKRRWLSIDRSEWKEQLELIKNFKDKNNKNFQILVKKLSFKNTKNISQIESKLISLKNKKSKFVKRFKAYNY